MLFRSVLGSAWAFAAARRRSLIGSPTVYLASGIWAALSLFIGIRLLAGVLHWRGRGWLVPGTLTVDGM